MSSMEQNLKQMIEQQKAKLFTISKRLLPHITPEDLLQPQDHPELEQHPEFRYEEGILVGLESALTALHAKRMECESPLSLC